MIILAREARGWNQGELAEKIHMSATNLSKIERGDVSVSEEVVKVIAQITGYPDHFFQQSGEMVPGHMGYRRRTHVAQKLLAPIHARTNIFRRHVQFLTRSLSIKMPGLPSLSPADTGSAAQLAQWLRREWALPPGPVENLVAVVERAGIPIALFDFETERVDSRSIFTDDGYPLICLNSRLSGDRQRFTLAYELGILLMRGNEEASEEQVIHAANSFAASLLMPRKDMMQELKGGVSIAVLATLKKTWKVSMIALLYRADDLGLLTPNQKRYLLQQFNALQIRRREPVELDVDAERPALLQQWISDFSRQRNLRANEMAALLCLHADEFLELYS